MAKTKATAGEAAGGRRFGWALWLLIGITAAVGAFLFAREQARGGGEAVEPPARGLPATPDYHALLVFPDDSEHLLLGTHVGIYESKDGGVSWRFLGLEGKDAMNLAHDGRTIWVAGHDVLERSTDGGRTWRPVRPEGLPHLDIHGFTRDQKTGDFYAAVAGEGLYRSTDGGASYREISNEVGGSVYGLALGKDGVLFASGPDQGVLVNGPGDGKEWEPSLELPTGALASNHEDDPEARLLAAGETLQLYDGGRWREVLALDEPIGAVAFAPGDPMRAYAAAYDRRLYRSTDGGETWAPAE